MTFGPSALAPLSKEALPSPNESHFGPPFFPIRWLLLFFSPLGGPALKKKILIWVGGSCLSPLKKKDGSERRSWKGTWSLHFHFWKKALFIFFQVGKRLLEYFEWTLHWVAKWTLFSPSSSYRPGWLPQPPEATTQPISAPPPPSDDPILAGLEEEEEAFISKVQIRHI